MKTRLLIALCALTGLAWGLSIDWATVDGGGGVSSGGAYSIQGTIGQPDAGSMSGGSYVLEGGFWAAPEVIPNPGGPVLTITRSAANSVLSWPAPSPGWRLERSTNLAAWTVVAGAPVVAAGYNTMTVPAIPGREFFRLSLP